MDEPRQANLCVPSTGASAPHHTPCTPDSVAGVAVNPEAQAGNLGVIVISVELLTVCL